MHGAWVVVWTAVRLDSWLVRDGRVRALRGVRCRLIDLPCVWSLCKCMAMLAHSRCTHDGRHHGAPTKAGTVAPPSLGLVCTFGMNRN